MFGGSTGTETLNDVWGLNIKEKVLAWKKFDIKGNLPTPRVYHSVDICQ